MHDSYSTRKANYRFQTLTNGNKAHESEVIASGTPEEVWQEAAMFSCDMIREIYGRMTPGLDWRMEVSDGEGQVIYRFSFKAEAL
jgi:hypothetical protein